jgi:hypothetical protein
MVRIKELKIETYTTNTQHFGMNIPYKNLHDTETIVNLICCFEFYTKVKNRLEEELNTRRMIKTIHFYNTNHNVIIDIIFNREIDKDFQELYNNQDNPNYQLMFTNHKDLIISFLAELLVKFN